jgi:hypothetical protein
MLSAPPTGAVVSSTAARFHLRDGSLVSARQWSADGATLTLQGERYDPERRVVARGEIRVLRDEVAVVETSGTGAQGNAGELALMGVLTVASVAASIGCAANPKACFGSCPTFYVSTPEGPRLQAEGFSASIASTLEEDDLDDLPDARAQDGALTLTLRNEAYETHALRRVALWVADAPAGSEVYRAVDAEALHAVGETRAPEACDGAPCELLATRDAREWTPGSDGHDLAARGTLTLRFAPPHAPAVGVVLTARNSLMSTFVMYHLLGLLGRSYGDFIARLEGVGPGAAPDPQAFARALGGVRIESRQGDGAWRDEGTLPYVGPIARATRVARLRVTDPLAPLELRLTFARAHWRFDAVRAGPLTAEDLPVSVVEPEVVEAGARSIAEATRRLRGEGPRLVNLPGDDVALRFALPAPRGRRAYFLRSRGYYYEWMRTEWLREENVAQAELYLRDPHRALRELATPFRARESQMDAAFEASRFRRAEAP